jgi:flavin-dependent dehydrogenase
MEIWRKIFDRLLIERAQAQGRLIIAGFNFDSLAFILLPVLGLLSL